MPPDRDDACDATLCLCDESDDVMRATSVREDYEGKEPPEFRRRIAGTEIYPTGIKLIDRRGATSR